MHGVGLAKLRGVLPREIHASAEVACLLLLRRYRGSSSSRIQEKFHADTEVAAIRDTLSSEKDKKETTFF